MTESTRLHFPLQEGVEQLDLGELASGFRVLDEAYRRAYRVTGRDGRASRPQVAVETGSLVVELVQTGWDVVETVDVLVTAIGLVAAAKGTLTRSSKRRRARDREELRELALQTALEAFQANPEALADPARMVPADMIEQRLALLEAVADIIVRLGVPTIEHRSVSRRTDS